MIEKGDIQKLTEISKNVFLKQIETYPLIVQIRRWLEIFTEEIAELRNRVQILEAEVDLLRRSRGIKAAETTVSKKAQAIQCSLTPEIIGQIRMAFACNIDQARPCSPGRRRGGAVRGPALRRLRWSIGAGPRPHTAEGYPRRVRPLSVPPPQERRKRRRLP